MNRKLIVVVGLTVLVGSLVFAGLAFAQSQTLPAPGYGPGYGRGGMMGGGYGRGMMGYGQAYTGTVPMGPGMIGGYRMMGGGAGPMHDYMLNAFAEAFDLSRTDLDGRLAQGETMFQIATAQGLSQAEFFQVMQAARQKALEQAVADGVLTQEQADWMLSHMGGRGHMGGRWQGDGDFGPCPYFVPTEPTAAPTTY